MRRVLYAALITTLAALVAAGCGDEDPPPAGGEAAPDPKAAFIAAADAICVRLGDESTRLARREFANLDGEPTAAEQRAFNRRLAALQRRTLAELRALPAPPGDEDQVVRIWAALEAAINELAAIPPGRPGQPGGRADQALGEFGELASAYGLSDCAQGL